MIARFMSFCKLGVTASLPLAPVFNSFGQFCQKFLGDSSAAASSSILWSLAPEPSLLRCVAEPVIPPNQTPSTIRIDRSEAPLEAGTSCQSVWWKSRVPPESRKSSSVEGATVPPSNPSSSALLGETMAFHFVDPRPFMPRGSTRVEVPSRKPCPVR